LDRLDLHKLTHPQINKEFARASAYAKRLIRFIDRFGLPYECRDELIEISHRSRYSLYFKRRSGGSPDGRHGSAMLREAAGAMFKLLWNVGIEPKITPGGDWEKLTVLLFKIATGRQPGDAHRACVRYRNWLRAASAPEAR
jgi:hypothetical protein